MALVIALAAVGSLVLTPLARRLACQCNALSRSDGNRKKHPSPTPVWGGLAVYLAAGFSIGIHHLATASSVLPGSVLWLGVACGILCLLGCYDDRFDMPARHKLLGQILATLPLVFSGYYVGQVDLFGYEIVLGPWGIAWTVCWLVLGINAMNLLDGMDGLASVVGLLISATVALLAWSQGYEQTVLVAVAMSGALAGFLAYNLPPAKIYLGDCGSMVLGLVVAFLAMQVSLDRRGNVHLPIAAAILFVPLLDTALAIIRRSLSGKSVMRADRGHIHHRLLDRGLGIESVLGLLGGICLMSEVAAGMAVLVWGERLSFAVLAFIVILGIHRKLIGHEEWKLVRERLSRTGRTLLRRSSSPVFSHWFRITPSPSEKANNEVPTQNPMSSRLRHQTHCGVENYPPSEALTWTAEADKAA